MIIIQMYNFTCEVRRILKIKIVMVGCLLSSMRRSMIAGSRRKWRRVLIMKGRRRGWRYNKVVAVA